MAIGRMKRITLIGPEDEGKKVTGFLQEMAVLEITRLKEEVALKELISGKVLQDEELAKRLKKLDYLEETLSPEKKNVQKIQLSQKQFSDIAKTFDLNSFYEKIKNLDARITKRKNLKKRLNKLEENLSLIKELEIPLDQLVSTSFTKIGIYKIPSIQLDNLIEAINKKSPYFYLKIIKQGKKESLFLILFLQEQEKEFLSLLARYNVDLQKFPPFHSTAGEILSWIEKRLVKNEKDILQLNEEMKKFARERNKILVLLDYYSSFKEQENIQSSFGQTKSTFVLTGWITERALLNLGKSLKEKFPTIALYSREPKKEEDVPTIFENKPLTEPFEAVTDLYGRPLYRGVDPSGFLSIFFILCFATCLSDSGYGILLAIFSLIILKKMRLSEMGKRLCKLFFFSGLATIVVGVITGSCFGDLLERVPFSPLRRLWGVIAVFNPVKNADDMMKFFYFALLFGYVQISFGVLLKLMRGIKDYGIAGLKNFAPFLIQLGLPLWILAFLAKKGVLPFSFLGGFFFSCLSFLLILALGSVIFRQCVEQKGIFMKLFWSVYSVYGMVVGNLLSDTLSYSRLFALGMTTALLAIVMNQLVSLVLPVPYLGLVLGLIIFFGGHLFNLAINTLGAYVHTSRLQYLEFFTKFYEAGGRAFKPFGIERKYTIIG